MAKRPTAPAGSMTERFNLMTFTDDLILDLKLLRAGKISVPDARARADLAKQTLRAVHYMILARKMLEGTAGPVARIGK